MSKRDLRAPLPVVEKSTLCVPIIVSVLLKVLPILCITGAKPQWKRLGRMQNQQSLLLLCGDKMSFGGITKGCMNGTNQHDRRDMKTLKLVAHMKDGTMRDVPTLIDYEDLRQSELVLRFEKVEGE